MCRDQRNNHMVDQKAVGKVGDLLLGTFDQKASTTAMAIPYLVSIRKLLGRA